MIKHLIHLLRKLGFSKLLDHLRYQWIRWKTYTSRREFRKNNPDLILPPDYYMYETFSLDYQQYYYASKEAAQFWINLFSKHINLENKHILDWGCGPGRIIRHMPHWAPEVAQFYGCDYNSEYTEWCSKNLPGIQFDSHGVNPPLPYSDASMDVIYGISIFTHLSEQGHILWAKELYRVLKPGGILCITLHGDAFKSKLDTKQLAHYDKDKLVTIGKTLEGHRTFIAFHPPNYVKKWLKDFKLLEHTEGGFKNNKAQQEIWLLQKPNLE